MKFACLYLHTGTVKDRRVLIKTSYQVQEVAMGLIGWMGEKLISASILI